MTQRDLRLSTVAVMAAFALLLAPMASAAPIDRVPAGLDLWQTLGSGATSYNFANNPLPADFFCSGSKAFTGRIDFEGVPMGGALGSTDTIIERLGTAVFDDQGVANTRIRARALNLVGSQKIATPCGDWKVSASLANRQPTSTITFYRQRHDGGVFDADLRLAVRMSFTNEQTGERHQLVRQMHLPTLKSTVYTCAQPVQPAQPGSTTSQLIAARQLAITDFQARAGGDRTATRTKEVITNSYGTVNTGTRTPARQPGASDACITGYICDSNGNNCMYQYSWHEPQADERHFTYPPCQLGYEQFCDEEEEDPIRTNLSHQLDELRELGYVDQSAEEILQRETNRIR